MSEIQDATVQAAVATAVDMAYDAWAVEHPTLASVIDRMSLTRQTAQSLRATAEYQQAVADYGQAQGELVLINRLLDLAGPILVGLLAM